jgi:putative FmdB family regulatory protein
MPLYEYECEKCGRFEIIRKFSDEPLLICPTCGGTIEKLLSSPAIQFKGTGWYVTDYAGKSGTGKAGSSRESGGKDAGGSKDSAGKDAGAKDSSKESKDSSSGKTSATESTSKSSSGSGSSGPAGGDKA